MLARTTLRAVFGGLAACLLLPAMAISAGKPQPGLWKTTHTIARAGMTKALPAPTSCVSVADLKK
jgi:Protein of unknown function (DUF3617).